MKTCFYGNPLRRHTWEPQSLVSVLLERWHVVQVAQLQRLTKGQHRHQGRLLLNRNPAAVIDRKHVARKASFDSIRSKRLRTGTNHDLATTTSALPNSAPQFGCAAQPRNALPATLKFQPSHHTSTEAHAITATAAYYIVHTELAVLPKFDYRIYITCG